MYLLRRIMVFTPSSQIKFRNYYARWAECYIRLLFNAKISFGRWKLQFFSTWKNAITKKNVPKICLANGLDFPEIPNCLKCLTPIEELLIMPRLPFTTIRPLGYQGQSLLKGAIVNITISVWHLYQGPLMRLMWYKFT